MIQDIDPTLIDTNYLAKEPTEDAYVLVYAKGNPCLKKTDDEAQPYAPYQVKDWTGAGYAKDELRLIYLFCVAGHDYFWLDTKDLGCLSPDGAHIEYNARSLRTMGEPLMRWAIALGTQLASWYSQTRFCPRCGHKLVHAPRSRELVCESCTNILYPRINPAVIVAIVSEDHILITQYSDRAFKHTALVAGYMEVGETPEECCVREAYEEVGIQLQDMRYVCSQPWPFSSSILLGYVAYVEGMPTPKLLDGELREALWVKRSDTAAWTENTATLTNTLISLFGKGEI